MILRKFWLWGWRVQSQWASFVLRTSESLVARRNGEGALLHSQLVKLRELWRDSSRGRLWIKNVSQEQDIFPGKATEEKRVLWLKVLCGEARGFLNATPRVIARSLAEGPLQAPPRRHLPLSHLSPPNWNFLRGRTRHRRLVINTEDIISNRLLFIFSQISSINAVNSFLLRSRMLIS